MPLPIKMDVWNPAFPHNDLNGSDGPDLLAAQARGDRRAREQEGHLLKDQKFYSSTVQRFRP